MHPLSKQPHDAPTHRVCLVLLVLACALSLPLHAEEPVAPAPRNILKLTDAVAVMRVTKISDELQNDVVHHVVTLTLCGRAVGLGESTELTLPFEDTSKKDDPPPENAEPPFAVGQRCLVLLAQREKHWETLCKLPVSEEGNLTGEVNPLDLELKPGTAADDAVALIAEKITKENRGTRVRPPPAPSARNQPWNLMRSSPLRRVWPFFPR